MITQVPELADGGYWYVVPVTSMSTADGPVRLPDVPIGGWCAWYATVDGQDLAAVRFPSRQELTDAIDMPISAVLSGWEHKPHGRVGNG